MISKVEMLPLREGRRKGKSKGVKNSIEKVFSNLKTDNILLGVLSFFISRALIMDGLTPFGIAFVTAYLGKCGQAILIPITSTIGLLTMKGLQGYEYIAVIWLIYFLHSFISRKSNQSVLKLSMLSCITFMIVRITLLIISEYFLYDIVMVGFEAVAIFTLTYIFSYSITTIKGKNKVFTGEEIICGAIMLALAISGIGTIELYNISLQNIMGIFLIILFSYSKGPAIGAAVGVTIGVVCGMSTPHMPILISILGFSGLLAGLFKDLGKIGTGIGFILGNGIITFYINGYSETFISYKEIVVAAVLVIIASKLFDGLDSRLAIGIAKNTEFKDAYSQRLKDITFNRLNEISQVFDELASTFNRVSQKERVVEQGDISNYVNCVAEDVCKNCAMHRYCWENDFYSTYYAMFDVMNYIETKGKVSKDKLPDLLKRRCIKPEDISNKCNHLFNVYKLNYQWENKISESRQLVSQQLDGVSKIIKDLANEIDSKIYFKEDVEKSIYSTLRNQGIDIKEVIVTESEKDNFEILIEMISEKDEEVAVREVIPIVSETVGFNLIRNKYSCSIPSDSRRIRFKLIRANKFEAITKVARSEESFNYISGDTYTFGERKNNYFAVLSDGMGMGQKANQESDITISLLEKFLEAGFDKELALKTINSILVLKSTDEIFATIDMSIIDLYRGETQFIKIGSAPTFIKKRDSVNTINTHSLPVGILNDVDFQMYEEQLEDGDFIIMMSDGVLDANAKVENKETWMREVIDNIDSLNPQVIADTIMEKAKDAGKDQKKDDMTVLVTKVWKSRR
ncbi:MAG: stage II sporulation protein E [Firmicutes bacterium]|nr:stage II sporulation protein E [Bacillota bacterium]